MPSVHDQNTPQAPPKRRIVLVHDWLVARRGGEAVLEHIARVVRREHELIAALTMFDSAARIGDTIDRTPHHASFLNRLPFSRRARRWLLPLYPLAVAHLARKLRNISDERGVDLVISTSSAAAKAIKPPPGVPHLCYCHSPPRYVWAPAHEHAGGARGLGLTLIGPLYRNWDKAVCPRVSEFIANSSHIAARIRDCYARESIVIHPPVDTAYYSYDPRVARTDRWLCVGALEPYKRFDLAIKAAQHAGRELDLVGTGSCERALRALAKNDPRIRFQGHVSKEDLRELYRTAAALLFPQVEDFGIVAAEAISCGCPVAANAEGGARDILTPNVSGVLVRDPSAESLAQAAATAEALAGAECARDAQRFDADRFESRIAEQISRLLR